MGLAELERRDSDEACGCDEAATGREIGAVSGWWQRRAGLDWDAWIDGGFIVVNRGVGGEASSRWGWQLE
jgi:hypothetical protein